MNEMSDYLKSNCRSWEQDCNNEDDTLQLAHHLKSKFNVSIDEAFNAAAHWTGFDEVIFNNEN